MTNIDYLPALVIVGVVVLVFYLIRRRDISRLNVIAELLNVEKFDKNPLKISTYPEVKGALDGYSVTAGYVNRYDRFGGSSRRRGKYFFIELRSKKTLVVFPFSLQCPTSGLQNSYVSSIDDFAPWYEKYNKEKLEVVKTTILPKIESALRVLPIKNYEISFEENRITYFERHALLGMSSDQNYSACAHALVEIADSLSRG